MQVAERIIPRQVRADLAASLPINHAVLLIAAHEKRTGIGGMFDHGRLLYLQSEWTGEGKVVKYEMGDFNLSNPIDQQDALVALGFKGDGSAALKVITRLAKRGLVTDLWEPFTSEGLAIVTENGGLVLGAWIQHHGLEHVSEEALALVQAHRRMG